MRCAAVGPPCAAPDASVASSCMLLLSSRQVLTACVVCRLAPMRASVGGRRYTGHRQEQQVHRWLQAVIRPCWSGQQRRVPSHRLPQLMSACQSWGLMKLCLLHACHSTSSMFGLLHCISVVNYHRFRMLAHLQHCRVVLDAPKALRRALCLAPSLLLGLCRALPYRQPPQALPHRQPPQALPHQLATPIRPHRC